MSPTFKKKFKKQKDAGFCVLCTLLSENKIKPSKQWLSLLLRLSSSIETTNSKGESVPTP